MQTYFSLQVSGKLFTMTTASCICYFALYIGHFHHTVQFLISMHKKQHLDGHIIHLAQHSGEDICISIHNEHFVKYSREQTFAQQNFHGKPIKRDPTNKRTKEYRNIRLSRLDQTRGPYNPLSCLIMGGTIFFRGRRKIPSIGRHRLICPHVRSQPNF